MRYIFKINLVDSMASTISMENLQGKSIHTTTDERSASKGAMTLTCQVDGTEVPVRTAVLRDEQGNLVTEAAFLGKTIDVRGVIASYEGKPQIKVYSMKDIIIH